MEVLWVLIFLEMSEKTLGSPPSMTKWKLWPQLNDMVPLSSVINASTTKTLLRCAAVCTKIDHVSGFFFKKGEGICLCSTRLNRPNHTLQHSPGTKYYILGVCEIREYHQLRYDLCVKVNNFNLTRSQSMAYCESEAGRLIRLDSQSKYLVASQYLFNLTESPWMRVYYIDGYRLNGTWVFSDNTEIPSKALNWFVNEPTESPNSTSDACLCIFILNSKVSNQFQHGDTTCNGYLETDDHWHFGFICERVV